MMNRRRLITAGTCAGIAWPFAVLDPAASQISGNAFIVSGFPAGGMGDLVSRPLAEKLRGRYATNVLVESKVGAGGRLAAEFVKRAAPDGLTILKIPASIMVLYPHIYKSLHFAGMMLRRAAGIEFTAVPYRGGAPLLTDMLAGAIPVSFNVIGEVALHVRAGKLRSLAVTSPQRSPFLPDVPTMVEQGFAGIALQEWLGWFVPARTSMDIAKRLNDLVRDGLQDPAFVASLANGALQPRYTTPEEFATVLRQDYERWVPIVKDTGFSATD